MYKFIDLIPDEPVIRSHEPEEIIPNNFVGILIGKPKSGKTRLINAMLSSDEIWGGLHDHIIYVTPTEKPKFDNPKVKERLQFIDCLKLEVLMDKIKQLTKEFKEDESLEDNEYIDMLDKFSKKKQFFGINKQKDWVAKLKRNMDPDTVKISKTIEDEKSVIDNLDFFKPVNDPKSRNTSEKDRKNIKFVLLVLDDCLADLLKYRHNGEFAKMFFNRRWLGENYVLNIIVTSQKLSWVPNFIRSQATFFVVFEQNSQDLSFLKKEMVGLPTRRFDEICITHWKEKPHNFIYVYNSNIFGNFSKLLNV